MAVASNALFNVWQNLSGNPPRLPHLAAAGEIRPSTVQCDKSYIVLTVAGTYTFEAADLNPINAEFTVIAQASVTANSVVLGDGEFATWRITLDSNGAKQWSLAVVASTIAASTFGDDTALSFGDSTDAQIEWSTNDADNHGLVLALGDTSQMLHITDKGAIDSDWAIASPTHPTIYIHSNTTPITDYLAIGGHDGTTAVINNVGGTTLSFQISGTAAFIATATTLKVADSVKLVFGTGDDITMAWDGTDFDVLQAAANSSIKWGVSDAGIDQVWYGDTVAADMTWDQSANTLLFGDAAKVAFGTGSDIVVSWDGTDLDITQATVNSSIKWGVDGAGIDQVWYGDSASNSMTWDQSADSLLFTASASIDGAGSTKVAFTPTAAQNNIAAAAGGALGITTEFTTIAADAGGDTFTLANGAQEGQVKKILFTATAGGTGVLTPTSLSGGTIITFSVAGDYAELKWNGTAWVATALYNTATGAINTPVLS